MSSNIRRIATNGALVVGAVLLSALLGEGAVRVYELWSPKMEIAVPNPEGTGSYRLKPGLSVNFPYHGKDVLIETNSYGMRWKNVALNNGAHKRRIAFLGDSFTFGESADRIEDSFVGVFDRLISHDDFEVLNFGVDGYGYDDMELLISEVVLPFKPEFIVIVTFNGNDFRDTYLGLRKYEIIHGVLNFDPSVLRRKIPEEYQRPRTRDRSWLSWHNIKHESRLVHRINNVVLRLLKKQNDEDENFDFTVSDYFTDFTFWSRSDYPGVANSAKNISLETLTRIKHLCDRFGINMIVISLPFEEQVYSPKLSGTDPSGVDYDINLPQKYVEEWANEHSVAYLDLLDAMRSYVERTGAELYPDYDMHINNTGHSFVGHLIYNYFQSLISKESHADARSTFSE